MEAINNLIDYTNDFQPNYDRQKELKAFDDTKLGVKGLVDSGVTTLPRIFIRPPNELVEELNTQSVKLQVPIIDFDGIDRKDRYRDIVEQVCDASEKWGFFQVINHGIPQSVLDNMVQGIKKLNEEDVEVKKKIYSRDYNKQVVYQSNYDLFYSKTANWRDTFRVDTSNFGGNLDPNQIPEICREVMMAYIEHVLKLSNLLLELLSVGLGLNPNYLKEAECSKGWSMVNHYYPACPAPNLTLGTSKHTDPAFLTILLQDQIGGLQVLHQNQWVDVVPIPGSFVVNIGDFLQILSNDKFKSVYHRVVANKVGPRISVGVFLRSLFSSQRLYGPIKELLSEEKPALYKDFTIQSYFSQFLSRGLEDSVLEDLKLNNHGDDM